MKVTKTLTSKINYDYDKNADVLYISFGKPKKAIYVEKEAGSWRSVKNTTPDKVWILCPTCHVLLDRMYYSPKELGLIGGDENA